jgi:hypothetical protein
VAFVWNHMGAGVWAWAVGVRAAATTRSAARSLCMKTLRGEGPSIRWGLAIARPRGETEQPQVADAACVKLENGKLEKVPRLSELTKRKRPRLITEASE